MVKTGVQAARANRAGRRRGRRPVRRGLVVTHRWVSLVLGLLLVVETTSGAVVLYKDQWFRATHGDLYAHTRSADPVTTQQAVAIVERANPTSTIAFAGRDEGILAVGDDAYETIWFVDPGTGRINGSASLDGGVMGFLANLHECALTCEGLPGYVSWLNTALPTLHLGFSDGSTWGSLILGVLGVLLIFLAVSGAVIWWPGRRRLSHGFRVRFGKGRFARDYDLHNLVGIVSVPFLLMWGVTGAAFEIPAVENAWLVVTGGDAVDQDDPGPTFEPAAAPAGAADIGLDRAIAAAVSLTGSDDVRDVYLTTDDTPYYSIWVAAGVKPGEYRAIYGGDTEVAVDPHDASHAQVLYPTAEGASNTFYDRLFEPAHFGFIVDPWWRIVWFVFGMSPLVLMVTGVSTWLFRRGVKKRRRQAAAARAALAAARADVTGTAATA